MPTTISLSQLEARLVEPASTAAVCRPYDLGDLQQRLSSFRAGADWFDKPNSLAPPRCARFGWTLEGRNLLSCKVCGGFLKIPSHLLAGGDAAAAREMEAAIVDQLTSAHMPLCPWRGNASPETLASLLLHGQYGTPPTLPHGLTVGKEALRKRVASLLPLPLLPQLSSACDGQWAACATACGFSEVGAWRDALIALAGPSRNTASLSAGERHRHWVAVALAILGWTAGSSEPPSLPTAAEQAAAVQTASEQTSNSVGSLECREDARTVGLWRFAPCGESGSSLEAIDPVAEHRSWSPWLEVTAGDDVPAWMRTVALLLPLSVPGRRALTALPSTASASAAISQLLASF